MATSASFGGHLLWHMYYSLVLERLVGLWAHIFSFLPPSSSSLPALLNAAFLRLMGERRLIDHAVFHLQL